jgi:hypothetical protein
MTKHKSYKEYQLSHLFIWAGMAMAAPFIVLAAANNKLGYDIPAWVLAYYGINAFVGLMLAMFNASEAKWGSIFKPWRRDWPKPEALTDGQIIALWDYVISREDGSAPSSPEAVREWYRQYLVKED